MKRKPVLKALDGIDEKVASPASPASDDEAVATARKPAAAQLKPGAPGKASKARRRPPRSSRPVSAAAKLVCRYCGSADLAPSFVKRRDARCRACFKQRYSSAKDANASRPPKARAAK